MISDLNGEPIAEIFYETGIPQNLSRKIHNSKNTQKKR